MLLRHLQHENVIGLRELMTPSDRDFKDLYIVQDLMDTDLHQIIRSSQPLSNDHLQFFIYQACRHTFKYSWRNLYPYSCLHANLPGRPSLVSEEGSALHSFCC